jgi:hypothetical protein
MYQPLWRTYSIHTPIGAFKYPKLDETAKPRHQSTDTDDEKVDAVNTFTV